MKLPVQSGQTWWNHSGGGALVDRVDGATIWYTKVKRSGLRTTGGALLQRSVFLRRYPLPARPSMPQRAPQPERPQPVWFSLRLSAEQLDEIEGVYGQLMGDMGLLEEVRELAEEIMHSCAEARGQAPRRFRPDLSGSRIARVRPSRTGTR